MRGRQRPLFPENVTGDDLCPGKMSSEITFMNICSQEIGKSFCDLGYPIFSTAHPNLCFCLLEIIKRSPLKYI